MGSCDSVVGSGTMLQAGRSLVLVPDEVDLFNLPNPSSCTMALRSTQPLTKMSTRNLPGVKSGRCVGLTTSSPSVSQMSENVGASTSRNPKGLHGLCRDNFTLPYEGWPNVLNISSALKNFQNFVNCKQTWIGWHRCSGTGIQNNRLSYLTHL
jgi:hypothetical protein